MPLRWPRNSGILSADPRNTEAITIRAHVMYLQDTKSETVPKLLSQALSFDPDNQRARLLLKKIKQLESMKNKGNVAFKAGQYEEAQEAYGQYLEADDEGGVMKAKVLSNRAIVRSKLSKHELAISDCSLALDILENLSFPGLESSAPSPADMRNSPNGTLFSKLYLRRADCYMKLEKYEEVCNSIDESGRGMIAKSNPLL